MKRHKIFTTGVGSVDPLYLYRAKRKGRMKAEVDDFFHWLTRYSQEELEAH